MYEKHDSALCPLYYRQNSKTSHPPKNNKRRLFNISSNLAHFTDYFKTDLRRKIAIATPYFPTFTDGK